MKMNKKVGALAGLAALAAVGGTWAFFSQSAAITNPFTTNSYNTSVVEHFNPAEGEDWKPGATVDKTVVAKNTGNYPVLVRVEMEEEWSRDGQSFKKVGSVSDGYGFYSVKKDGDNYSAYQHDPEDGLVPEALNERGGDDTVVYKNLNTGDGKWFYDFVHGYWYWSGLLEAGTSTEYLMDSVTLASNTDMGLYAGTNSYYVMTAKEAADAGALADNKIKPDFDIEAYVEKAGKEWIIAASDEEEKAAAKDAYDAGNYFFRKAESGLDENAKGYADANYDLTITTHFVQATKDAVDAEWGADVPPFIQDLIK